MASEAGAKLDTTCVRPPADAPSVSRPLVPPLVPSAVYRVASLDQIDALYEGREPGFIYARDLHPNLVQLAEKVAALEGAETAWVGASGMAVEASVLLACLQSGDQLALADGVYGRTGRLAAELSRFGVSVSRFDPTRPHTLDAALGPRTRVVFAETISNPLLRVADVPALAQRAHAAGALLVIDHTFAALLCRPLGLGADLVTHSATKLLGGHSDLTLGVVAGRKPIIDRVAATCSTFGMTGNPFECWLCLRGLATLAVRLRRACETTMVLARRLADEPHIRGVHYPGLSGHPDYTRARDLLRDGFGTIVTIDLGDRAAADRFIQALRDDIPFAPSLGDVATTLSHPATTSHRGQSREEWARQGITPGLLRLSVGLEDVEDLWREIHDGLRQALG